MLTRWCGLATWQHMGVTWEPAHLQCPGPPVPELNLGLSELLGSAGLTRRQPSPRLPPLSRGSSEGLPYRKCLGKHHESILTELRKRSWH